ncbi:guanylyl cyclase-activating protein 2-like [Oncorhynchus masou masou]|uniref:guanylyl cyclase-activating protein 2-like n=1 Tax=Oncorhynchus masou masou TaxID=90313 RepID=UPI0031831D31
MGQAESHKEMDLEQIQELCMAFMKECPSGALHLHELKRIFGIPASCEEETLYIETVFHSFDTNRDNALDFMEYTAALHLILRGNLEDRLKWSFKIYDKDGNGKLDREEVKNLIRIIYNIKRHGNPSETENLTPDQITDRIFDLVDKNKDSQISLEEFLDGAQKDQWVLDQLQLDIRPCGWFLE